MLPINDNAMAYMFTVHEYMFVASLHSGHGYTHEKYALKLESCNKYFVNKTGLGERQDFKERGMSDK